MEVTCVDSADKVDTLRALGADHVMDYRAVDFSRTGEQYDTIVDTKTNRSPFACAGALKPDGRGGAGARSSVRAGRDRRQCAISSTRNIGVR